jgi:hypothetical protein
MKTIKNENVESENEFLENLLELPEEALESASGGVQDCIVGTVLPPRPFPFPFPFPMPLPFPRVGSSGPCPPSPLPVPFTLPGPF